MNSMADFYRDEELKQLYDETLEKKILILQMLDEVDGVLYVLEHYFDTGEYPEDLLDE